MSDYRRYGDADFASRDRDYRRDDEREFERSRLDRDEERGFERSRRGLFDDRDDERDRGFFGGSRSPAAERRGRYARVGDREESRFGYDDDHEGLPIDETSRLIASNKVEGTSVYGRDGSRLGTIYNLMTDKYTGQVEYAVMRYGGFLGLAQRYYPLPWRILTYDPRQGGYRINLTDRDMERAPSFGRDDEPRFNRDYGRRVHNWYGLDY